VGLGISSGIRALATLLGPFCNLNTTPSAQTQSQLIRNL